MNYKTYVDRFVLNKTYTAFSDYEEDKIAETIANSFKEGDQLRFTGKTLGYAVFKTSEGKPLYLKPRQAFKLIGLVTDLL